MKNISMKIFLYVCAALCLFITGCTSDTETHFQTVNPEKVDVIQAQNTEATGSQAVLEQEMPLSQELAMLEGFVVMQDGDVRHNAGSWFSFLEACEAGQAAAVTVVQYIQSDSTMEQLRYDLSFDGTEYVLSFSTNNGVVTECSKLLRVENGLCNDTQEPYDCYEAYLLNDIILYKDLIAAPDYEGITDIFLHSKEGEPPVKQYSGESLENILQLLMTADYMPIEPENYLYGMKLLMTNRDGKELVIELDLRQGIYRYGMQTYAYGEVSDLLDALGIDQWPESVLEEFAPFLN